MGLAPRQASSQGHHCKCVSFIPPAKPVSAFGIPASILEHRELISLLPDTQAYLVVLDGEVAAELEIMANEIQMLPFGCRQFSLMLTDVALTDWMRSDQFCTNS